MYAKYFLTIILFTYNFFLISQSVELKKEFRNTNKFFKEKNYEKALISNEKALILSKKEFGDNHLTTATLIENKGRLFLELKQFKKSESLFKEVIKIRKSIMEKTETYEYQLKLGMIIRFIAESNDNLHNKIFLIDYLDNDLIKIINDNFDRYQLTINDGKLSDESIEEVHILEEPNELGYAKQHGLKMNTWWTFHFGGTIPEVVNGEITNLEEDCIEITTYPNKDIIYIDFQYKGIPLNLPLVTTMGELEM